MTMDITSTEVQYLTGSLLEKQEPVTYRTLSRELQIHHANAKRILYEFYVANKDKVYAKFIVTGYNEKGETTIQLLDENSVFLQLSLPLPFKEVHTIHIYCLVKRGLSISDIQISIHEHKFPLDYTKLEEYYKNGVIRVPKLEAVEVSNVPARAQPKAEPRTVQPAPNSSKLTPTTPSSGLTSGYVSRKAQVKKPVTADITSKYTSRKQSTPQLLLYLVPLVDINTNPERLKNYNQKKELLFQMMVLKILKKFQLRLRRRHQL